MTKNEAKNILARIEAELPALGQKLGLKLTPGRASYGDTVELKIEAAPILADGSAISKEAEDFKRYAMDYGLEPSDLGRTFDSNGWTFTLTGLRPGRPKFPLLARRSDGKIFKFPIERLARLMAEARQARADAENKAGVAAAKAAKAKTPPAKAPTTPAAKDTAPTTGAQLGGRSARGKGGKR